MLSVPQNLKKKMKLFFFARRTIFLIRNRAWDMLSNMEQVKNFSLHCNTSQSWEQPTGSCYLWLSLSVRIWWNDLITCQRYFVPPEVCTGVIEGIEVQLLGWVLAISVAKIPIERCILHQIKCKIILYKRKYKIPPSLLSPKKKGNFKARYSGAEKSLPNWRRRFCEEAFGPQDFSGSRERVKRCAGDHLHACKVQSQRRRYQMRGRQTNRTETILQTPSDLFLRWCHAANCPEIFSLLSRRSRAGERDAGAVLCRNKHALEFRFCLRKPLASHPAKAPFTEGRPREKRERRRFGEILF